MHHKLNKDTPQFDVQLLFDEIGAILDDHQYRDMISLIDMYHFYSRQHKVLHNHPSFVPPLTILISTSNFDRVTMTCNKIALELFCNSLEEQF